MPRPTNRAAPGSNGRRPNRKVLRRPREKSWVCSVAVLALPSAWQRLRAEVHARPVHAGYPATFVSAARASRSPGIRDHQLVDQLVGQAERLFQPRHDAAHHMVVAHAAEPQQVVLLAHVLRHQELVLVPQLDKPDHRPYLGEVAARLPRRCEVPVLAEAVEPGEDAVPNRSSRTSQFPRCSPQPVTPLTRCLPRPVRGVPTSPIRRSRARQPGLRARRRA